MELPKISTKVIHSETKPAWNVVATSHGDKYKIARVPYTENSVVSGQLIVNQSKQQAYEHAKFISDCFNGMYKGGKGSLKKLKVPSISDLTEELVYADEDYALD